MKDTGEVEGRMHLHNNPYLPYPMIIRKIISENAVNDIKTFELVFKNKKDEGKFTYMPGQFAEVSIWGAGEAPIGIASSPTQKGYLQFTVKKMGVVTSALHNSNEGDEVGIRGPYGNWFPMDLLEESNVYIIGGGFAFTTLRSLTNYILHPDNRDRFEDLVVIYGARDPGELIYKYELKEWSENENLDLVVTVDKGDENWTGREGYVPTIVKEEQLSPENAVAVVCGPPIMIKFTFPVLLEAGFSPDRILNSLEMRMKCGIGKCGRCNIGSKYVCKDGPIFTYAQLQEMPKEY